MQFNLLDEKWLSVLRTDGRFDRVGIREALRGGTTIRTLNEASPLEEFAVIRLLLAFTHWRHPIRDPDEWHRLWRQRALPDDLLAGLSAKQAESFDLFGDGSRFYQDQSVAGTTPLSINNLLAELPSGTNINHFAHVYDPDARLCPCCIAKALIALPPFCTEGGRRKSPSVNGAPPIYFYPVGATLAETLLLNLPVPRVNDDWPMPCDSDGPAWDHLRTHGPTIGYCEGLTWQPRRVFLGTPDTKCPQCRRCGESTQGTVKDAVFTGGRTSGEAASRRWRDPHVALVDNDKPLRALDPVKLARAEAGRWRDELLSILRPLCDRYAPPAIRQAVGFLLSGVPSPDGMVVRIVRYPTSRMKLVDAATRQWTIPLDVWRFPRMLDAVREALDEVEEVAAPLMDMYGVEEYESRVANLMLQSLADIRRHRESPDTWLDLWRGHVASAMQSAPRHAQPIRRAWSVLKRAEIRTRNETRALRALAGMKGGQA